MEPAQKKGMSKGCLVAIIVAASLVVLLLILFATCWYYKDDLMKMGGVTAVNTLKTNVAENPPAGTDTVYFNAVADAFTARMKDDPEVDMVKYQEFFQTVQYAAGRKDVDAALVDRAIQAMIGYYPELREIQPTVSAPETEPDTLLPQQEDVDSE